MLFHHKNIRLSHTDYIGQRRFFFPLCCAERRKRFSSPQICNGFLDILRRAATRYLFAVHAHCLMPDHIHLLAEGLQPQSDALQFMRVLKRNTSTRFQKEVTGTLWQKKYYDHMLRNNDSPDAVAWYIWMNPIRANLCHRPEEYPHSGSLTQAWKQPRPPTVEWLPPWRKTDTA
jgi:REP element-mobilizing transposase RayT